MLRNKTLVTTTLLMLSCVLAAPCIAEIPSAYRIEGVPRIKQLTNYCGPACIASVMQFHGSKIGQEQIGKAIYSPADGATTGGDMLFYSRQAGYAAYTWNSSVEDVKKKIAAGFPVIVLEYNSASDTSGHYRVLVGYSDLSQRFFLVDPYYDKTEMSYQETDRFWRPMGFWALIIAPTAKDQFRAEMETSNPVLHMDLSLAQLKRRDYDGAMREANAALSIQPHNPYALSLARQIRAAMGAGRTQPPKR
jgi:hypothetical protein